jgi:hypothetical protein
MREVSLKIPEKQFNFFIELFQKLGLEVQKEDFDIPEKHKEIVRERVKNLKEEELIPWEEARKKLKFKTK